MQALSPAARFYLVAMIAAGACVLVLEAPRIAPSYGTLLGVVLFAVLAVAADLRPVALTHTTTHSVTTALYLASLILFGGPATVWAGAFSSTAADLVARKAPHKVAFNAGVIALSIAAGDAVFSAMRHSPIGLIGPRDLPAVFAYAFVNYLVNQTLVATIVGLVTHAKPWEVAVANYRGALLPVIALYPLGVLISLAYAYFGGWLGLILVVVPLFAIYRALNQAQQLRVQTQTTLELLADAIDRRDRYTAEHSQRVAAYAERMALVLGLPLEERETVVSAARVHDLGKIFTPDAILKKPGSLDENEWEIMRAHPRAGAELLSRLPMYRKGALLVGSHHERLDGAGYPHRLHGRGVPRGACILAVADAFDAMASDRPYRRALPVEVAVTRLQEGVGTQFSREAVDALVQVLSQDGHAAPPAHAPAESHGSGAQRQAREASVAAVPAAA
ncbi:MAG: HD-GYP domain-containing protein [Chloroflexi bacterium]|nr:HD-GYP domain-containing protein [Chloroflexota bacterium]